MRWFERWHLPASSGLDASGVTLRRLLSHTSGLVHRPRHLHPFFGERVRFVQAPGVGFQYSNVGYALVQMLIEDVTGEPFADYMRREVLEALGMHHSHFGWTPQLEADGIEVAVREAVDHGSLARILQEVEPIRCTSRPAFSSA